MKNDETSRQPASEPAGDPALGHEHGPAHKSARELPAIVEFGTLRSTRQGRFVRRTNRFVVEVDLVDGPATSTAPGAVAEPGARTTASLPNPGRLGEILLPGTPLALTSGPEGGKHPWRVVSATVPLAGSSDSRNETVFLDTGATNRVARVLLDLRSIPALAGYAVERAEVSLPGTRSRVDFLLRRDTSPHHDTSSEDGELPSCPAGEIRYLEVKSCTLFNGRFAMFPDAATDRGRRHVEELAATGCGAVLFVVHTDRCGVFFPDIHTDLDFSRSLAGAHKRLPIIPVGVRWSQEGSIVAVRTDISIPWGCIERFLDDSGYYLVLLYLPADRSVETGALGSIHYRRGWYVYVGSAQRGLTARINRHRRKGRKKKHWHIDYFREACQWVGAFPIREPAPVRVGPAGVGARSTDPGMIDREEVINREEEIAAAFESLADLAVPRFGASDSRRASHLFWFREDPRLSRLFVETLLHHRRVTLERCLTATGSG